MNFLRFFQKKGLDFDRFLPKVKQGTVDEHVQVLLHEMATRYNQDFLVFSKVTFDGNTSLTTEVAETMVIQARTDSFSSGEEIPKAYTLSLDNHLLDEARKSDHQRKKVVDFYIQTFSSRLTWKNAKEICPVKEDLTDAFSEAVCRFDKWILKAEDRFSFSAQALFTTIFLGECKRIRDRNKSEKNARFRGAVRNAVDQLDEDVLEKMAVESFNPHSIDLELAKKKFPFCFNLLYKTRYLRYPYKQLEASYQLTHLQIAHKVNECLKKIQLFFGQ